MFVKFRKDGPPLYVEVYVDGRAHIKTPDPCTLRDIALFKLFEKGIKDGEIRNIDAGRYTWNFTKTGWFATEAELTRIDG